MTPAQPSVDAPRVTRSATAPLTNLAHLDFLGDRVTPPQQAGHTTYRLAAATAGRRALDLRRPATTTAATGASAAAPTTPTTDTYGQGAFNADDMARAAVVYLRHWKQTGAASSRARGLRAAPRPDLPADRDGPERRQRRAVDAARRHPGPERGPGRAARPVRQRRVVLAGPHDLGAGRGLRRLPQRRPGLRAVPAAPGSTSAVGALDREVLDTLRPVPEHRRPADARLADRRRRRRLAPRPCSASRPTSGPAAIADGATRAGAAQRRHRRARRRRRPALAVRRRPAVGPVALGLARLGLADAGGAGRVRVRRTRRPRAWHASRPRDSFTFDPWLLTSGGPDNGRLPTRSRRHPDRLRRGLARRSRCSPRRTATGRPDQLAGIAAAWFFGANACRRRRRTTPPPASPSTGSPPTAPSTTTPVRSPRSTAC